MWRSIAPKIFSIKDLCTSKRKQAENLKQLGRVKRQKSQLTDGDVETPSTASRSKLQRSKMG
jgi:hypothetical protein